MRFPTVLLAAGLLVSISAITGCAATADSTDSTNSDVTTIPQSSVKDQEQTGNCWLYATLAWVESLSAKPVSGETKDLSPAYLNYWEWYRQITDGNPARTTVDYGGFWGRAVEHIEQRGVMRLGKFVSDDATASVQAQQTLNLALQPGGELGTPEARADLTNVRAVMDRAFGLTPAVSQALTTVFGDGSKTFDANGMKSFYDAKTGLQIKRPADITVRAAFGDKNATSTLSAAIGSRAADASDQNPGKRDGLFAWSIASFDVASSDAAARRTFLKRIQHALNDGVPLPIAWNVVFSHFNFTSFTDHSTPAFKGALDPNLTYVFEGTDNNTSIGGHETLLTDYTVANVPGYGTLKAGIAATDAQKNAALADTAQVLSLRVKNSWGTALSVTPKGKAPEALKPGVQPGYFDLDVDYLFSTVTACAPDGLGQPDPAACVAQTGLIEVVLPARY